MIRSFTKLARSTFHSQKKKAAEQATKAKHDCQVNTKKTVIVQNLIGGFRSKCFPRGPQAVNESSETYHVKAKLQTREEMSRQVVRFTDNVSQAVFNKSTGSKRCIDNNYHLNERKKSRLHIRDDIQEEFWAAYEDEVCKRLIDKCEDHIFI